MKECKWISNSHIDYLLEVKMFTEKPSRSDITYIAAWNLLSSSQSTILSGPSFKWKLTTQIKPFLAGWEINREASDMEHKWIF